MPLDPLPVRSASYPCPRCEATLYLFGPRFKVHITSAGATAHPRACCHTCGQVILLKRGKFVRHGHVDHRHLLRTPIIMMAYTPKEAQERGVPPLTPEPEPRPLDRAPDEPPGPIVDEEEEEEEWAQPHRGLDEAEYNFLYRK